MLTLATALATRPCVGESANGDAGVVRRAGALVLLAVVDALGHGPQAELVADRARAFFEAADLTQPVAALFRAMHGALSGSRGAAVTACVFDGVRLRGGGVGNVTLRVQGSPVAALLTPGIVGGPRLAPLRTFDAPLAAGDRLAFFSDGLAPEFDWSSVRELAPERACELALARAGRPRDDATVLLADVTRAT